MGSPLKDFSGEFGKSFLSIVWKDDGLLDGLNNGSKRMQVKVDAQLQLFAPEIENWMKSNAPWTDQTGNARNGLAARAYDDGSSKGIILFHQVPYGLWLEVRFSGRYAVIRPALDEWGPRVFAGMSGLMEEI